MLQGPESFRKILRGTIFLSSPKGATETSRQHRTPPNYSTTNVAVDRNAPAARLIEIAHMTAVFEGAE